MKIYTNVEFNPAQQQRIQGSAESPIHFASPEDPSEIDREAFLAAEIAFGSCPPHWIPFASNLRWLQLDSIGFGEYVHLDWGRLAQRITCTNLRGFFAVPVSETALAGILALYRGLDRLANLRTRRSWQSSAVRSQIRTLKGARVLLIGYGAIGQALHSLLLPFDCSVKSMSKSNPATDFHAPEEVDRHLPEADIVCVSLPDTPETRALFDGRRLSLLKNNAVFVNVGRGSVVDELALQDALVAGRLSGAIIDVTQEEPLPPEHPFWECPNLILTQHTGGGYHDELDRMIDWFLENLRSLREGRPLKSIIDWKRGY